MADPKQKLPESFLNQLGEKEGKKVLPDSFLSRIEPVKEKGFGTSFVEGLEIGGKQLAASASYLAGDIWQRFTDNDIGGEKLKIWAEDYQKTAPESDDSWGQFLGSLVPSTVPVALSLGVGMINPTAGAALGRASVAGLTASSAGQGMMEYDAYKKSKGELPDDLERLGVGAAYGAAEYLLEKVALDKLLPVGMKGALKTMKGNPEAAAIAGKKFISDFIKKNPKGKSLVGKLLLGSQVEGGQEALTELAQGIADATYKEKEDIDSIGSILTNMGKAYLGGAIMGTGLGGLSYKAQDVAHNKRRNKQGFVRIGQMNNEGVEILGIKDDKVQIMYPDGNVSTVNGDQITNMTDVTPGQFQNILKGKTDETNAVENSRIEVQRRERDAALDDFDQKFKDHITKTEDGGEFLTLGSVGEASVIVHSESKETPGSFYIVPEEGGKVELVSGDKIENMTTLPVTEWQKAMLGPKLSNIADPSLPAPEVGEPIQTPDGPGHIIAYDVETGDATIEIQKQVGKNADDIELIQQSPIDRAELDQYRSFDRQIPEEVNKEAEKFSNQFDENGNPIEAQEDTSIKELNPIELELEGKKEPVIAVPVSKDIFEISGKKEKEAQKMMIDLTESYPNMEVQVVDKTDKENSFARSNFVIQIKTNKNAKFTDAPIPVPKKGDGNRVQVTRSTGAEEVPGAGGVARVIPSPDIQEQAGSEVVDIAAAAQEKTKSASDIQESKKGKRGDGSTGTKPTSGGPKQGVPSRSEGQKQKKKVKVKPKAKKDEPVTESKVQKVPGQRLSAEIVKGEGKKAAKSKTIKLKKDATKEREGSKGREQQYQTAKEGRVQTKPGRGDSTQQSREVKKEKDIQRKAVVFEFAGSPRRGYLMGEDERGRQIIESTEKGFEGVQYKVAKDKVQDAKTFISFQKVVEETKKIDPRLKQTDGTDIASEYVTPFTPKHKKTVEKEVAKFRKKFPKAPGIEVMESHLDLQLKFKEQPFENLYSRNAFFDPRDQKVYIVAYAPRFADNTMIEQSLLHEVVGHYGIRKALDYIGVDGGKKFNDFMNSVFDEYKNDARFKSIYNTYKNEPQIRNTPFGKLNKEQKAFIAEEFVAHVSETNLGNDKSLLRKIIDWFKDVLGVKTDMSDDMLRDIIANGRRMVQVGDNYVDRTPLMFETQTLKDMTPEESVRFQISSDEDISNIVEKRLKRVGKSTIVINDVEIPIKSERELSGAGIILTIGEYGSQMGGSSFHYNKEYDDIDNTISEITDSITSLYNDFIDEIGIREDYNKKVDLGYKNLSRYHLKKIITEELPKWKGKEINAKSGTDYVIFYDKKLRFSDHVRPFDSKWNSIHGDEHIDISSGLFSKEELVEKLNSLTYGKLSNEEKNNIRTYFDKLPNEKKKSIEYPSQSQQGPRFQLAPPVESKAFKDWFGDSQMTDKNGDPIVFYHRTNADFTVFDKSKVGAATDAGWLGQGFYFYGEESEAYGYGDKQLDVYLKMENPYYATDEDNQRLIEANDPEVSRQFTEDLINEGYDGVFYNGDLRMEAVVFEPNQIKSIENTGSWDINNPDIRFQKSPPVNSKEFKRWFGESTVTDNRKPGGTPLVTYHGTTGKRDFTIFRTGPTNPSNTIPFGSHFSVNPLVANLFAAEPPGKEKGGRVYPVYLSIKNPLDITKDIKKGSKEYNFINNLLIKHDKKGQNKESFNELDVSRIGGKSLKEALENSEYDGIRYTDLGEEIYVPLNSNQVKSSTGNIGTYSPTNPDIRFQKTEIENIDPEEFDSIVDLMSEYNLKAEKIIKPIGHLFSKWSKNKVSHKKLASASWIQNKLEYKLPKVIEGLGGIIQTGKKVSLGDPIADEDGNIFFEIRIPEITKFNLSKEEKKILGNINEEITSEPVFFEYQFNESDYDKFNEEIKKAFNVKKGKIPYSSQGDNYILEVKNFEIDHINVDEIWLDENGNEEERFNYETTELWDILGTAYSATKNYRAKPSDEGGFYYPNIRFQKTESKDNFYSNSLLAIRNVAQGKATSEQWKAMLLKNGASQSELDWIGFDEWLKDNPKPSKEEVYDFIHSNKIEVVDVVKGDLDYESLLPEGYQVTEFPDGANVYDAEGNHVGQGNTPGDAIADAGFRYNPGTTTKYSDYQLPGGENYKELLLTMPNKATRRIELAAIDRERPLTASEQEEYDRLQVETKGKGFKSSHWDEPNILSHIRFNERTGPDGSKILFIEEIQSDWAQEGRKKGFKDPTIENQIQEIESKMKNLGENPSNRDEYISLMKERNNLRDKRDSLSIPNMPFKQTSQWLNLSLRRMIRYASENGFDRIAWINGQQSADRYDLSKQVDEIIYEKYPSGYTLYVRKGGSNVLQENDIQPDRIEELVGKEVAERIVSGKLDRKPPEKLPPGEVGADMIADGKLSGLDLKVGGEGMINFYDKIIPSQAKKVINKLDKDVSVNPININTGDQLSFEITPPMRQKAIDQGMPMFQKETPLEYTRQGLKGRVDRQLMRWQDRYIYLKRLQDFKKKQGREITDDMNAYDKENLSWGKINEQDLQFKEGYVNPLDGTLRALKEDGLSYDETSRYLRAKHIYVDKVENGGIPILEAKSIVEDFESRAYKENVDKLIHDVDNIRNFILEKKLEYGLISKARFDTLNSQYEFYVPLRGFADLDDSDKTVFTKDYKREGRTSESGDPIPYLMVDAQTVITKGEQNKVKQALLEFVKYNPDSKLYRIRNAWYLTDKKTGDTTAKYSTPTPEEFKRYDVSRSEPLPEGMTMQQYKDYKTSTIYEQDAISVMVDGKKIFLEFTDGNISKVLKGQGVDKVPQWASWMNNGISFLRKSYTQYSPEFGPRNFIRDISTGLINVQNDFGLKTAFQVLRNVDFKTVWKGIINRDFSGKNGGYMKDFIEAGGLTGYSDLKDVATVHKEWERMIEGIDKEIKSAGDLKNAIKQTKGFQYTLGALDNFNRMLENTVRYATYKTLRDKGLTSQQAAIYAKDVTVNFNRKGTAANFMGSFYLFWNASIQGIERLGRPFIGEDNVIRKRAITTALTLPMLHLSLALINEVIGGDDDDGESYYSKLSEYDRTHNLILPNPFASDKSDAAGKFFRIPLPYGYNVFFAWPDHIMRAISGKQSVSDALLNTTTLVMESFSPLGAPQFDSDLTTEGKVLTYITPTVFKTPLEVEFNKNFMGLPIYKEQSPYDTPRPDSEMYFSSVDPVFKEITKMLNKATGGDTEVSGWIDINPEVMEHYVSSYSGGLGKFMVNSMATAMNIAQDGKETFTTEKIKSVPFVRNYITSPSKFMNRVDFYEKVREVEAKEDILNRYKKSGNRERAIEYRKENISYLRLGNLAKNYRSKIKSLEERRKRFELKGDEDSVKLIEDKEHELYKKFNKEFKKSTGGKSTSLGKLLGF